MKVRLREDTEGVYLGVAQVTGDPSRVDERAVDELVRYVTKNARTTELDPQRVRDVRQMLKFGRYRATGRGKPAHEFLFKAAREERFPRVSGPVDVLNAVSLSAELPMSLIDLERAQTRDFVLRRGHAEETYIFNASGQTIGLHDLLLVARLPDDEPCANPVKDAMTTKLIPESSDIAVLVYAPSGRREEADAALARLAEGFAAAWPGSTFSVGMTE